MPSIKELSNYKVIRSKDIWIEKFGRGISLYLTKLLLRTPITTNQLTVGGIIIGLIGVLLITSRSSYISLIGYLLILFYYLTDMSDGQFARYKKTTSLKGKYYDHIGHLVIYPLMFLAVGFYLFNKSSNLLQLLAGMFTTIFSLFCFTNGKFYSLITGRRREQLYQKTNSKKLFPLKIMIRIHKTITFNLYVVISFMITELITFLLSLFLYKINLLFYLLLFYMIIFLMTFFLQTCFYSHNLKSSINRLG